MPNTGNTIDLITSAFALSGGGAIATWAENPKPPKVNEFPGVAGAVGKDTVSVAVLAGAAALLALASCASPGQPPNAGNLIVGNGAIVLGDVAISEANARLSAAYTSGKLTAAQYTALYAEEVAAQNAVNGLGQAIAANQPVTQAQVDAAVATFLTPLSALVPATLPPPIVTTRP